MTTPVERWVEDVAKLTCPDNIHWCDGSEEECRRLVEIGMTKEKINGKFIFRKLNPDAYPKSYLHISHPQDVARTEHLTFVNHPTREMAGPNNNWMCPEESKKLMRGLYDGCMKGRTMYVLPYLMGHPDSPYAKACVQVTDSTYVAVSMRIMTRMSKKVLDLIGDSENFVKGVHSVHELDPERRYIMHYPEERLVMSVGSGYGGNALLGKKCLSLRIASYLGRQEMWLAEHMIIAGVKDPQGDTTYLTGAFPSACGKTNLAMLESTLPGWSMSTLGDDIAWLNIGPDKRMYAINPEAGFFGVAPQTSMKTNPTMMKTLQADKFYPTLFTNTALDTETNTPWWEGIEPGAARPAKLNSWKGEPYQPDSGPAAHPNSRFTVSVYNCPGLSPEYDNPKGVPISAIIFGARRSRTTPLVVETFDWRHGVFCAATMGSETTAAAAATVGVVRRDPMAMLPFCGYNMADYFAHWLKMGTAMPKPPRIFMVNWFRKDEAGNFIWPGYRENMRVIKWILDRVHGRVEALETPLGFVPRPGDLDVKGLGLAPGAMEELFRINPADWKTELDQIGDFFTQFGAAMPEALLEEYGKLKQRLAIC